MQPILIPSLLGLALLASPLTGRAGTLAAPLRISLTLLERCQLLATAPDSREARCGPGVARTLTTLGTLAAATVQKTGAARSSLPLPKETAPGQNGVAIVF